MASFFETVKERLGRFYEEVDDAPLWFATQVGEALQFSGEGLAKAQRTVLRYWDQALRGTSPTTPLPASIRPPFEGGQCPGRMYSVKIAFDSDFGDGSKASDHNDYYPAGILQEYGPIPGPINVGEEGTSVFYEWSENAHRTHLVRNDAQFSYQGESYGAYISDVVVTPDDGQPDECGDPASDAIDPSNQPLTDVRDVEYEDENGNPQTAENVTFTYGLPFLEPDGTISVPYEVCYDNFCYKGKTNFGDSLKVIPEPPFKSEASSCPTIEEIKEAIADEIKEIADAIGVEEFPGEVPETLLNSGDNLQGSGTIEIPNLTQFILWIVKQMDALIGEFPIKMQIEDVNLVEAGNQPQTYELSNLAEAISELFSFASVNKSISEANLACSTRQIPELNACRISAIKAYEVARANAEFLGYRFKQPSRDISSNFNYSEDLSSLSNFFEQKDYKYAGFEFDDKEVLPEFLQRFMFAAHIIKGAFYRTDTEELERLQKEIDESEGEQDDRWDDFVNEVNNPDSYFNQDQSTRPFLKDSQED